MSPRSAALLVLLGALWGGSFVFMRVAVPALGPVALSFARVALAAAILLAVAGAQRGFPDVRRRWRQFAVVGAVNSALPFTSVPGPVTPLVVANVVALAAASTAVAYLIYFKLIADIGPARALTVTFLIPLFGALWGFVFLGEALTADMLAGGALVVAGTVLALRSPVAPTKPATGVRKA